MMINNIIKKLNLEIYWTTQKFIINSFPLAYCYQIRSFWSQTKHWPCLLAEYEYSIEFLPGQWFPVANFSSSFNWLAVLVAGDQDWKSPSLSRVLKYWNKKKYFFNLKDYLKIGWCTQGGDSSGAPCEPLVNFE